MRNIKYIYTLFCILFISLVSCSDDDINYKPGELVENSMNVYFDKDNEYSKEFSLTDPEPIELDLIIKREQTTAAANIPISVVDKSDLLDIPESITFAAGEAEASIKIKYAGTTEGIFNYDIEIGKGYSNPYIQNGPYSVGGTFTVGEYLIFAEDAIFTPGKYSGSSKPPFIPFKSTIYKSALLGKYRIANFLNSGYDFSFALDDNNNIVPDPNEGYHSTSDSRWYFYSGSSLDSEHRIPCYIPCEEEAAVDYITYIYFYTSTSGSSHYNFNFNEDTKSGDMLGYARFSKSSSGRINFEITWE